MNLTFINPGFEHSIDSILLFQKDDTTPYWMDALFYFYPEVSKEELKSRSMKERKNYLMEVLRPTWIDLKVELDSKILLYNLHWQKHLPQIQDALSDAFETDISLILNDLHADISLNPVCPRFLEEHYFDVFYKNSERGALGVSIHEIIHYIWFHVWNGHFHDCYEEYDTPSLKWILSEMVVESIMSDGRLSTINPYYPREHGGCVYRYFQDMIINERCVLDTIDKFYRSNSIVDFMEESYQYCLKYEDEIREHIAQAEKEF